jgi:hypothetical protein
LAALDTEGFLGACVQVVRLRNSLLQVLAAAQSLQLPALGHSATLDKAQKEPSPMHFSLDVPSLHTSVCKLSTNTDILMISWTSQLRQSAAGPLFYHIA